MTKAPMTQPTDIVERLNWIDVAEDRAKGNALCRSAAAEITRLRERLEVVPGWSEDVDGIGCRDETIRLQDERIERLRTKLAEAHTRGVKAGLEAALKALKTAQYDPAPYTKGSSAIRAIDPASVEVDHG